MVTDRSTRPHKRLEPHDLTKETPARSVSAPMDSSIPDDTRETILPGDPNPPPALDWGDPAAVQHWIDAVRLRADDAIGAGRDATARKRRRVLSRAEARRKIRDADSALAALFSQARPPDVAPCVPSCPATPRDPSVAPPPPRGGP